MSKPEFLRSVPEITIHNTQTQIFGAHNQKHNLKFVFSRHKLCVFAQRSNPAEQNTNTKHKLFKTTEMNMI
jgi:hypothetical protein